MSSRLWVLVLLTAETACGARIRKPVLGPFNHSIKILVTRHAFSWANVVSTLMGSIKHATMRDPLLTDLGVFKSVQIGVNVEKWLQDRDEHIDAVIASTLVRAMETAMFQYPGHTVHVAPFIAETGLGLDNKPMDKSQQLEALADHVGEDKSFKLDYRWPEALGNSESQSWAKFLEFLRTFFLPELLTLRQARGEQSPKPIVLAVVTHSNFMSEGEIASRCKQHYPDRKGKIKANNNQVLQMEYNFVSKTENPSRGVSDATLRYLLEPVEGCEVVSEGMRIINEDTGDYIQLCQRDFGTYPQGDLTPPSLEREMTKLQAKTSKISRKIENLRMALNDPSSEKIQEALNDSPSPAKKLSRKLEKWTRKVYNDTSSINKAEKLQELTEELDQKQSALRRLAQTPCQTGGFPEPLSPFGI